MTQRVEALHCYHIDLPPKSWSKNYAIKSLTGPHLEKQAIHGQFVN